jgi:hypothetical protein
VNENRGRQNEPGWRPRADDPAADILEQGRDRFPPPNWRVPRGAAILLAAGLVIGLGVGYEAGDRQRIRNTSPSAASPGSAAPAYEGGPALVPTDDTCAAQSGRKLQLGAAVTNGSARPVRLSQIRAKLPLGGLRAISQRWAPCGAFETGQDPTSLGPGDSAWFSVTFQVLVRCPQAFPVWFTVGYRAAGQDATTRVPGFPDLGQVPYTGCTG